MIYLGVAISVLSMILDNVTTVIIFALLTILVPRLLKLNPAPFLIALAMLSNIGGAATLVGDPPNIMIGSAADIDFITFLINMAPLVAAPWLVTLLLLLVFFRRDLRPVSSEPVLIDLDENRAVRDPVLLRRMLLVMGLVVILFFVHHRLGFYPSFVSLIGLALALMWIVAFLSALIDNIPFTVTMIPIIGALSAEGVDVYPLWWALAIGVALGGNGTHIGATANIVVVAQAERSGLPNARITPLQWLRVGLPVMLSGLVVASLSFALLF